MPLPVITVAQMREWEKVTWASGQTEEAVIRLAGQAVARQVEQLTRSGSVILVLAGKGHNGDDAELAAESIADRQVAVLRAIDPEKTAKELKEKLRRSPALIVDGLFGIGLNRPLAVSWIKLLQQINQAGRA
jgi:NAD(P)H-hydrate repair Nnr-like enzyme with NAD(P)H-hydrate epimerase domain